MKLYDSVGTLRYSTHWLVVDTDLELIKYYRWWIKKERFVWVNTPMHGAHITVVAGKYEDVSSHPRWKAYDNQPITFQYSPIVECEESYWWLTVYCERLSEIRRELGLSDLPKWQFHLTIGNTK
jgi:hypothetical protein